MKPNKTIFLLVWMLFLSFFPGTPEANKRHKRELIFPRGGSFVAAVALTSFLPKGPTDGLAHILEFDLGFPFPERFAIDKKDVQKKSWILSTKTMKTKRHQIKVAKLTGEKNLKEEQRKNLRLKIEDVITRIGFNGSSCASRFQCELQRGSSKNSLLEELLFALFKNSKPASDLGCEAHNLSCPVSLLHIIMHSEQIPSFQII